MTAGAGVGTGSVTLTGAAGTTFGSAVTVRGAAVGGSGLASQPASSSVDFGSAAAAGGAGGAMEAGFTTGGAGGAVEGGFTAGGAAETGFAAA